MDDFGMGYALGQDSGGGSGNSGGFGGGLGDSWLGLILFAMIFGWNGNGFGGGFGGGGQALTRAELYDGFAIQNIDSAVRGVQQGICDSTYALNNSIMSGFHGVDNAVCTLGYQTQAGFNTLGHQISDCCCQTQRAIDRVAYENQSNTCALQNTINSTTRDIIDSQNAGTRAILDFLVQEKLSSKDARIAALEGQLGRAEQNGVIRAAIDASTAEIIRRTGNDCPVPSYLVQPPTPVNFPVHGCGTVQFGGYGGCGCGCG